MADLSRRRSRAAASGVTPTSILSRARQHSRSVFLLLQRRRTVVDVRNATLETVLAILDWEPIAHARAGRIVGFLTPPVGPLTVEHSGDAPEEHAKREEQEDQNEVAADNTRGDRSGRALDQRGLREGLRQRADFESECLDLGGGVIRVARFRTRTFQRRSSSTQRRSAAFHRTRILFVRLAGSRR